MKTLFLSLVCSLGLSAASVTVTSITCAGQTATLNATAHGIARYQGFSLSGTSGTFNSNAWTASANALTFVLPAGTPCSGFTSGYTSILPAKQIINIGSAPLPAGGNISLTY